MNRLVGWLAVLVLVATLAGCVGGTRPAARVLAAPAINNDSPGQTRLPQQLTVALPIASTMLDNQRVLVRPRPGELAYLTGVAWPDAAPRVLQDSIIKALQARSTFAAVGRQGFGLRGDALLHVQIHRLEIDYSAQPPEAVIEMQATLAAAPDGHALAQRGFTTRMPVAAIDAWTDGDVLAAAVGSVAADVADWCRLSLATLAAPSVAPSETSD